MARSRSGKNRDTMNEEHDQRKAEVDDGGYVLSHHAL